MDTELQELAGRAPDRPLESLEADIWVRLGRHERAMHASRRLLVLQAAVLLFTLVGSLVVGRELARQQAPGSLAVFSEQMPLAPAATSRTHP